MLQVFTRVSQEQAVSQDTAEQFWIGKNNQVMLRTHLKIKGLYMPSVLYTVNILPSSFYKWVSAAI